MVSKAEKSTSLMLSALTIRIPLPKKKNTDRNLPLPKRTQKENVTLGDFHFNHEINNPPEQRILSQCPISKKYLRDKLIM